MVAVARALERRLAHVEAVHLVPALEEDFHDGAADAARRARN
jgi:hypothetical protein